MPPNIASTIASKAHAAFHGICAGWVMTTPPSTTVAADTVLLPPLGSLVVLDAVTVALTVPLGGAV